MEPRDESAPAVAEERESYTYPRLQVPLFGSEYMEYARRQLFTRHPDYLPTLVRLLDVHPGMMVIDVNCGAGFYSRLIASRMQGEGQVVGIDDRADVLTSAQRQSIIEGWNEIIIYQRAELTKLPAPDHVADLVFANSALWTLPEAQRVPAIREMLRVTKPGGRVLVTEPDGGLVQAYDPQRPALQALEEQVQAAFIKGVAALDGQDYLLGRKLPTLFQAAGFQRVRVYPRLFTVAGCDLGSEPKQGLIDRLTEYQQALAGMTSDTPRAKARRDHRAERLRAGGLTDAQIAEHEKLTIERLKDLTEHPERILQDTSVYLYGGLFCEGYKV